MASVSNLMGFVAWAKEKWVRFSRQFGGLTKMDFGFDYAASFSVFSVVGSIA
jgi:hypothetical protein